MRLDEVILRGTRSAQPAATSRPGWLYCVTDEANIVERSNGTAWEAYSPAASSGGGGSPSTNDFRLTLASGNPVYAPLPATPSSTDTTGDTCTFASAHGWVSGTIVTPASTIGGLTAGTRYYINANSSTVVSFHTTVANALAGTSKVDLTASITAQILPSGISNTTLYLSLHNGNVIGLYTGSAWSLRSSAEVSLALGTLTINTNYDVFAYWSGSAVVLELLAWTSDTARATALARQDGVSVKSGDATRRYIGTIRADSTTTTIDDAGGIITQTGAKRFVWNAANQVARMVRVWDSSGQWNYMTNAWRQANNAAGNKVEWVNGLSTTATVTAQTNVFTSGATMSGDTGVNFDSVTRQPDFTTFSNFASGYGATVVTVDQEVGPGYHYAAWMEGGNGGGGTTTWMGRAGFHQSGLSGKVFC